MSASGSEPRALRRALARLGAGNDLEEDETTQAVGDIMSGSAGDLLTAAFLVGLRAKGEAEAEIAGVARALRERCTRVAVPDGPVMDTCGTGGDGLDTFNISTATALVVAGAGVPVAKHGNRSVSSRCGSADVMETLGVPLLKDAAALARCLARHNLAFLHAPHLHPAMRHAAAARKQLGIPTVFNLAGPLANPAMTRYQVLGVPDPALQTTLCRVFGRLGAERAWVVNGDGRMDELTTTGANRVVEWKDGTVREFTFDAVDLGLPRATLEDLAGGDAAHNAALIEAILDGSTGAGRDVVLLNAAAALVVAGRAPEMPAALLAAAESIDSGSARRVLQGLRESR